MEAMKGTFELPQLVFISEKVCVSRSEREKAAKHPYEIILKNISGSSLSFGNSKLKISDEERK